MSEHPTEAQRPNILHSHDLRELTKILVVHHDIHEGLFDVAIEFQVGVGVVGPNQASATPGASIGVMGVGLVQTGVMGPNTINAAEVNPAPKTKAAVKKPATKKPAATK